MRPLRVQWVQSSLAWMLAAWMRFCFATIRWTHEDQDKAEAVWDSGGGVICAFWHGRIGLSPACWPHGRAQPAKALISLSADGQFIAKAVAQQGFPAIRGSTGNKDAPERDKGGTAALREVLRWVKSGGGIAVTPDGPRGPVREMGEGVPLMAKLSGAPVLFIGLSCRPAIRTPGWDDAILPMPFGRGAIVWDSVVFPKGGDLGEVAKAWEARLTAVEARADAITAGRA